MQATFLLGPAGSGKTRRCLKEIRTKLESSPDGAPLILLAPKQATFQLERQLLAGGGLEGYTRLHILSFERLAEFVFRLAGRAVPPLLDEAGRVMVLRALLGQHQKELRVFRSAARLPGFAQQASRLLRELQRHRLNAPKLVAVAARSEVSPRLADKLHDLALILQAYHEWLVAHQLEDGDRLLDLAVEALSGAAGSGNATSGAPHALGGLRIAGLWLDGFAEMTPQEVALLAAVSPFCEQGLLAFCVADGHGKETSWLSPWTVVSGTFRRCEAALSAVAGNEVRVERLARGAQGRFAGNALLEHIERHWASPQPYAGSEALVPPEEALRVAACASPEAEAVFVAREIRRFVRERQGRYRDCAVLLRSLEGYHDTLRAVFTRYEIPFFLDRREAVAHHPLAELTRYALRTAAFGWRQEDWFGAMKTGLTPASEADIDRLENEALAQGWEGTRWQEPLPRADQAGAEHPLERVRRNLVAPFAEFAARLAAAGYTPTGAQLGEALRSLWAALDVEDKLSRWSKAAAGGVAGPSPVSLHETVWQQMNAWTADLERAFAAEPMAMREWLPIVEAGLSGLSVGVIPPALDQVLVGAIDRSRNPDLKCVFVLGLNELVFPAPPPRPVLLSEAERDELALHAEGLGGQRLQLLGQERYLGYIAATRARERVMFTFARRDAEGRPLNPSVFVPHLQRLWPELSVESVPDDFDPAQAGHASELVAPLVRACAAGAQTPLAALPVFQPVLEKARMLARGATAELTSAQAGQLYGAELAVSINALEDFAECPFKFFVGRGLRAQERQLFEPDVKERGSFQHEILKEFHRALQSYGQRWRDVMVPEAQVRIRQIGEDLTLGFREGLFAASAERRFQAEVLIAGLERLMGVVIDWMRTQYEFDPAVVEVDFGLKDAVLPGWRVDLGGGRSLLLRGRIDRIDLCPLPDEDAALAVVIDYKSSEHKLDTTRLHHGLQLQLLGYLNTLRHIGPAREFFQFERLVPAGVFYVNLKGKFPSGQQRREVLEGEAEARIKAYQHLGRFDGSHLARFDNRGLKRGDQFRFALNKDDAFAKTGNDALAGAEFLELLDQNQQHVRRIGNDVFAGKVSADPYRLNQETACDYCEYRGICRFDPWVQPYRVLRPPPEEEEEKKPPVVVKPRGKRSKS